MKMRFTKQLDVLPPIPEGTEYDAEPSKYVKGAYNIKIGDRKVVAVPASFLEEICAK